MKNCRQGSIQIRLAAKAAQLTLALLVALAVALAVSASGQTVAVGITESRSPLALAERAQSPAQPLGEVFREIDDTHTGDRWLLIRDAVNAQGPGRLVRIGSSGSGSKEGTSGGAAHPGAAAANEPRLRSVIHAGDALIVEEHTAVVDARLEAVALGPAVVGARFKARLKIGGKVVRVIALAKGRAALAPESETQP